MPVCRGDRRGRLRETMDMSLVLSEMQRAAMRFAGG